MEFTFDVDVSQLPCGVKASLDFVNMNGNGATRYPTNNAGAKYGTGYCDAQCPKNLKFINGEANLDNKWGNCCAEFSLFDANMISASMSAHPCTYLDDYRCEGNTCGEGDARYSGLCDKDGCDLNTFRGGNTTFYGPVQNEDSDFTIDTTKKMTVVTQFLTLNHTTYDDPIVNVTRIFIQGDKILYAPNTAIEGMNNQYNSIRDDMCNATKKAFGDFNHYN